MARIRLMSFLLAMNLFGICVARYEEDPSIVYARYVNNQSKISPISCRCPIEADAICNCEYNGRAYSLEAPLAAMIVQPLAQSGPWLPSPYILPGGLPNLSGTEEPIAYLRTMPRPLPEITAKFKLFWRTNDVISEGVFLSYDTVAKEQIIKYKPEVLYVVIHGWTSKSSTRHLHRGLLHHNLVIRSALIKVSWPTSVSYSQSAVDAVVIGNQVGLLLFELIKSNQVDARTVHLLGLDLGSHIATMACQGYGQLASDYNLKNRNQKIATSLGRRTGFNPLARHFHRVLQLDEFFEADFVDIYHTTTALSDDVGGSNFDVLNRRLGVSTLNDELDYNSNQIDFYPNGGQPSSECDHTEYECELKLAVRYFVASLRNNYNRSAFTSYKCDSYGQLERCSQNRRFSTEGVMGIDAPIGSNQGNHFLHFAIPREIIEPGVMSKAGPVCRRRPSVQQSQVEPQTEFQQNGDWPSCGVYKPYVEARMYQGLVAQPFQYPWAVCILAPPVTYADTDWKWGIRNPTIWDRTREASDEEAEDSKNRIVDEKLGYQQKCTGSLVGDQWVVTAAHCFQTHKNLIPFYLVFGEGCYFPKDLQDDVQRFIVQKQEGPTQSVFYPEHYPFDLDPNIAATQDDIVLLRLREKVKVSPDGPRNPICFMGAVDYAYNDCSEIEVAGFGDKGELSDGQLTWMPANVIDQDSDDHNFHDTSVYNIRISNTNDALPDTTFALGNFESHNETLKIKGRSLCGGDSGGPVMDLSPDKPATLVGTLQAAQQPCNDAKEKKIGRSVNDPDFTGVKPRGFVWIVRLSAAVRVGKYATWMKETIEQHSGGAYPPDNFEQYKGILGTGPKWGQPTDSSASTISPPAIGPNILG